MRERFREAEEEHEFLKKEQLEEGVKYRVERVTEMSTRYGPGLVAHVIFRGRERRIFLPRMFKMSSGEVIHYNYIEEKFFIVKIKDRLNIV